MQLRSEGGPSFSDAGDRTEEDHVGIDDVVDRLTQHIEHVHHTKDAIQHDGSTPDEAKDIESVRPAFHIVVELVRKILDGFGTCLEGCASH